jgi:hypothetical protein
MSSRLFWTIASPSPVPPAFLVSEPSSCVKRSKAVSIRSTGMPMPESRRSNRRRSARKEPDSAEVDSSSAAEKRIRELRRVVDEIQKDSPKEGRIAEEPVGQGEIPAERDLQALRVGRHGQGVGDFAQEGVEGEGGRR